MRKVAGLGRAVAGRRSLFRLHLKAWGCSPHPPLSLRLAHTQARKLEQRKLEDEATGMFELAAPVDGSESLSPTDLQRMLLSENNSALDPRLSLIHI